MANKKKQGKPDKGRKANKTENAGNNGGSGNGMYGIVAAVAVVGLAYGWAAWQAGSVLYNMPSSRPATGVEDLSPLERLGHYWPAGGKVAVQAADNGTDVQDRNSNRGLVATQKIRKGDIAITCEVPNLEAQMKELEPELAPLVESTLAEVVKEKQAKFVSLNTGKILSLIRFLQLVDIEKDPKWTAYADTLPTNVTSKAWYWTREERKCIVPRPHEEATFQNLEVFHPVFAKLAEASPTVQQIYTTDPTHAEWAYLMMTTRGFGKHAFVPVLDMTNHDPLQAAPTFFMGDQSGKIYLVATHDIQPGEPIYNNYGPLTAIESAERYGFVQSAYFASPSIHRDLWRSELTNSIPQCTKDAVQFFGDVGGDEVVVEAQLGKGTNSYTYSTTFAQFMPTSLAFACIKVLIQSEKDQDIARYVGQKMEQDYKEYAMMADAEHCQSNEGNFPLIRRANQVTASLMWETYEWAQKAAKDPSIPYADANPKPKEQRQQKVVE